MPYFKAVPDRNSVFTSCCFCFINSLRSFETVALALDVDDGAVMQNTRSRMAEAMVISANIFIPLGEGLVAGKDSGDLLIPSGNELEEQISSLNIHG